MRPSLAPGRELQAECSVSGDWPDFEVTFESGDGRGRNSEYAAGVEIVLARLGELGAELRSARISSENVVQRVAQDGLDPTFTPRGYALPVKLQDVDSEHLRLALGNSGALVNSRPGSSGSTTRKMTLGVRLMPPALSASALEAGLALGGRLDASRGDGRAGAVLTPIEDLQGVDAGLAAWLAALEAGSEDVGQGRRFMTAEGIVYRASRSSRRPAASDVELAVRDRGTAWAVGINPPAAPVSADGLTSVARDAGGRRLLIRQGRLHANPGSDGAILDERFRRLSGLTPVKVQGMTSPTPRDWYVVADIEDPPAAVRAQTASFVHACAEARERSRAERSAPSGQPPDGLPEPVPPGDAPLVRRLAAAMDAAASGYEIGQLQALRVQLRGLKKRSGGSIFSARSTQDEWAFHGGGRDELQFNIGLDQMSDGRAAVRAGVGFSLEQSRTLPDWRVLAPLIARLNEVLRERADEFTDLAMWEWSDGVRGPDRPVGPIDPAVVRSGVFIFLGDRQSADAVDVHHCLRTFDRLLPVYREVLTDWPRDRTEELAQELAAAGNPAAPGPETLDLNGGVTSKKAGWITATYVERTLDIELRHNELQNRLKARLEADGLGDVMLEARLGQRAIDLVVRTGEELWFYEVKTGESVRRCLREAIGQLLEYALWPGATLPSKLVVVGEGAPTADSEAYLAALNARFPVSLVYEQFRLD